MLVARLAAWAARPAAPLHDVATDYGPHYLPNFIMDHRCSGPQLVPLAKALYSDVRPLVVDSTDAMAVFDAAREAAQQAGLSVTVEEAPTRLQALATTRLLRFQDDFVVTVRLAEGGAALRVDARSRSRIGVGDLGANGARILRFMAKLRGTLVERGLRVLGSAA